MIEVKAMERQDLEQVEAIERATFSMPWSEKGFLDSMRMPGALYLTARLDGRIAGYCGMLQCMDEAEITNVAVRADCRRAGVAHGMLQCLLEQGAERGVRTFILEVRRGNKAAISLYEKLGFETCGTRKNFYEKPREDAIVMWKR